MQRDIDAAVLVPADVLRRLREYRDANGRQWRAKLCRLWADGQDGYSPLLRQARNLIGPSKLYEISLD